MRLAPIVLSCSAFGLIACAPPQNLRETEATATPVAVTCDATQYSHLVGQDISVVDSLYTGLTVRVLAADSFVTRDYDPNRLTFTTTPKNTVGRVFCG